MRMKAWHSFVFISARISAYLDEASQLKKLSPNTRAIAIAGLCGYDNVPLCGDIYLGKLVVGGHGVIGDGKGPIRNLDLSVEDCNSDAEWLRTAKRFNYEHGLRTNQVTMDAEADGSGGEVVVEAGQDQNSYKWSQSDEDIEISIVVPTGTGSKRFFILLSSWSLMMFFSHIFIFNMCIHYKNSLKNLQSGV